MKTILIVEDEVRIREGLKADPWFYRNQLDASGYRYCSCVQIYVCRQWYYQYDSFESASDQRTTRMAAGWEDGYGGSDHRKLLGRYSF